MGICDFYPDFFVQGFGCLGYTPPPEQKYRRIWMALAHMWRMQHTANILLESHFDTA